MAQDTEYTLTNKIILKTIAIQIDDVTVLLIPFYKQSERLYQDNATAFRQEPTIIQN